MNVHHYPLIIPLIRSAIFWVTTWHFVGKQIGPKKIQLGGGNSNICLFSPRSFGEVIQFDLRICFKLGWFNHQLGIILPSYTRDYDHKPVYQDPSQKDSLGGGNSNIFVFSPRTLGKMNPFWRAYFSDGLVQPPTSLHRPPVFWGPFETPTLQLQYIRRALHLLNKGPFRKVYSYYWYMFTAFVYGKPQCLGGGRSLPPVALGVPGRKWMDQRLRSVGYFKPNILHV